ncbi:DUF6207 family protein [Streptomyces sp. NPDC091204]|uniref:DUF6207 family protein n=1 Tax=Streptomyces sp. NPDC091204 TaxID=3155299 RepID=UPI00342DE07E
MKPIDEKHIAEPGLVVLDVTGGDEDAVRAVMAALEGGGWATSGVDPVRRDPGEPGVRARVYADVTPRRLRRRRPLTPYLPVQPATAASPECWSRCRRAGPVGRQPEGVVALAEVADGAWWPCCS